MSEALKWKDEGNKLLKEQKYDDAINAYTKAIELDDSNPIFFSNRAQVHIKLENYGLAIADCDAAAKADPSFMKAYYRKGVSLMALLNYKEAQNNFKIVLQKLPNDKLTLENHKQCVNYLKKEAFEKAIAGDEKSSVLFGLDFDGMLVEKSWEGPQLDIKAVKSKDKKEVSINIDGLDHSYLKYMIDLFKKGGKLPKKHVFAIVAKVNELLRNESSMVEISLPHSQIDKSILPEDEIILENGKKLTVVGDTHGQFYDVLNLFDKFGFVSDEHVYLFNGDFVDRGSWSCEVALYLYVLKILYPHSFFMNRGNHETNDMNKTYGFTDECEAKYSKKVFEAFAESFGALPLATLINRSYLVMHGGLFSNDQVTLEDIKNINRFPSSGSSQPPREGLAMELLWTDPQQENGRSPSKRGLGIQFGPDITEKFCVNNKIRKILRSHEVRMGGFEIEHNGRLITVFSAPNYCDATGNKGAVVHFAENKSYDKSKDSGEGYKETNETNCPWTLEKETFEAVPHPDMKPMAYSKAGFGF
ncbi:hypothetical protein FT663_00908 [Candidozyma haemuli var. vulneris]|uniref:Serine/threonine-protein phosphatase n=1 Tax=Candidozyma haemuli TaxID=45357 RepID=A0A2V1AS50_9ASCO|nr:hypothetical protein CXQ85_001893 [[Candida] haemuloni]KAF3993084.1 hypothetical protein FT662_00712 [[Candida] haemuloni var. vulneris]KAF3994934.1 hypothetical protein FT663_00908 [[Candida] haemuloni var. vulneris]PVH20113.1 hypothetical protein CXQ85_001893 [[Candida] haemuloni]